MYSPVLGRAISRGAGALLNLYAWGGNNLIASFGLGNVWFGFPKGSWPPEKGEPSLGYGGTTTTKRTCGRGGKIRTKGRGTKTTPTKPPTGRPWNFFREVTWIGTIPGAAGCPSLRWVQAIKTDDRPGGGCPAKKDKNNWYTYIDPCPGDDGDPFYLTSAELGKKRKRAQDGGTTLGFYDRPEFSKGTRKEFELCLVCDLGNQTIQLLDCVWWGSDMKANPPRTLGPTSIGTNALFLPTAMNRDFPTWTVLR